MHERKPVDRYCFISFCWNIYMKSRNLTPDIFSRVNMRRWWNATSNCWPTSSLQWHGTIQKSLSTLSWTTFPPPNRYGSSKLLAKLLQRWILTEEYIIELCVSCSHLECRDLFNLTWSVWFLFFGFWMSTETLQLCSDNENKCVLWVFSFPFFYGPLAHDFAQLS